jgi:hypothetical protein
MMVNHPRPKQSVTLHPSKNASKERQPDNAPEEAMHAAANRHMNFSRKFKHLGSWITQDLGDNNTNIPIGIGKATPQVHGSLSIWRSNCVSPDLKKLLHLQLPLNDALWGAESWTLTAKS